MKEISVSKFKVHLRPIGLGALAIGLELFFVWFVISVLPTHNIHWRITIVPPLQIDFYGALIPIALSGFFVLSLFYLFKFPPKQYFHYFRYSALIVFTMSVATPTGVIGLFYLFGIGVGFFAGLIKFYKGKIREIWRKRDKHMFEITKRNYIVATLLATSYASLSTLILDLVYYVLDLGFAALGFLTISAYDIGGGGLIDGILMSGVSAALGVVILSLLVKAYFQ